MPRIFLLTITALLLATSCDPKGAGGDGPETPTPVNFNRPGMLSAWMDDHVLPNYRKLGAALNELNGTMLAFSNTYGPERLTAVREDFRAAYLAFQAVSPVTTGPPEELRLRGQFNTYPTDTELIAANLAGMRATGEPPNFDLPSQTAAQGFPALDYLLHTNDAEAFATDGQLSEYSARLILRLVDITGQAITELESNRNAYVQNHGNSATSSVDRTVNDYIFYVEKFLRAGKVGIPAGVFSDTPLPDRVEAPYGGNSKELFATALAVSREFFSRPNSLADYLDALDVRRDGEPLSATIDDQFVAIAAAAAELDEDFGRQVSTDNPRMLQLYDELQQLIVLLKVDLLQALGINVDYVDADGD